MVTTFLVEHPWITTLALIGNLVVGPLAGWWLVPRQRLAAALGLLGIVPVAALTLVPTTRDMDVGCTAQWTVPTLGAVELMANVVLFIPPALLFGVAVRQPVTVLVGVSLASVAVEVVQAFATGLGRSCSTNDWLANTIGGGIGATIAALALRLRRDGDATLR